MTTTEKPVSRKVELTIDGGIALIRLNRPEQRNALSDELLRDLEAALDVIDHDAGCRVIVVTGNGPAFCAGADLRQLLGRLGDDRAAILSFVRRAGSAFARLEESPLPVIAAVNGAAVAGGFELLLACDIVLAAEGALLGDGHLRYGVLPGGGSAVRLERKVPANIGRRLLLTGDLEPAERFREWGLVEEVVPVEEVLDHALVLARRLAGRSALGVGEMKRVAKSAWDLPTTDALVLEFRAFEGYVDSFDLHEGLSAFRDGRTPQFEGR